MSATTIATTPTATKATSNAPELIVGGAIFLGLNAFFIGLRCYTKARISKTFSFNEILMIIAVFAYASLFSLVIFGIRNGVGGHTASATILGISNSLKFIFFLEVIYVLLTSAMKASLAISLLQWARKKSHIILLWAAIGIDATICIVVVLYFMLECTPISYKWEFINPQIKGKCLPATGEITVGFALSGTTVSLDMMFLAIPWFMMRGRGLNKTLKKYIYGIFFLGVLASFANFLRLATLSKLSRSKDPLFDAAPVFLWSAVEVGIGIMAAGILELSPLMHRYKVKGFEASWGQMVEGSDTVPINGVRLQSMDKSSISWPMEREVDGQRRISPGF